VQGFADHVAGLATASQARKLSAVKSLLTFAHRLGYVAFNVGAPVRIPAIKATLAERIMGEADVQRMHALETDTRNAAMLRLVYCAGLRISEVCGLSWRDMVARDDAGQVTVYGKGCGGKTRVVLLPASVWRGLVQLRGNVAADAPVFVSQRRGHLDPSAVHRVVKATGQLELACRLTCPPIGCAMPTRRTHWIGARQSIWCRPRWATRAFHRPASPASSSQWRFTSSVSTADTLGLPPWSTARSTATRRNRSCVSFGMWIAVVTIAAPGARARATSGSGVATSCTTTGAVSVTCAASAASWSLVAFIAAIKLPLRAIGGLPLGDTVDNSGECRHLLMRH
jgi:hypothetical protein